VSPTAVSSDSGRDTAVDPRIAARRQEVARGLGRRRRRRLVVVLAVLAVLAVGWLVTRSALLDVNEVVVEGNQRTSTDDLLAAASVNPGDPLVDVDAGAVRDRVLVLPWIADARVERGWGGTVRLTVSERTPVASVARGDGSAVLVDVDGRVLAVTGDVATAATSGVVPLEGVGAQDPGSTLDEGAHDALAVASSLSASLRSRVAAVAIRSDGGLELRLRPQGTVVLGHGDDPQASLASLLTVLAQVDLTDLATIDLRVPDQPVVSRVSDPSAAPTPPTTSRSGTGSAGATTPTTQASGSRAPVPKASTTTTTAAGKAGHG